MPRRVLVTGCSGYFGTAFVRALLAHPLVRRAVGVDTRAPRVEEGPKFRYCQADIRNGVYLRSVLENEEIDTVYHLAFLMGEFPHRLLAHSVNVDGALAVAEAANKASPVRKLVVASSTAAYGARLGNRLFLTEDAPLRARGLPYAVWKRRTEEELARVQSELRPDLQLSVLRLCTLVSATGRVAGPVSAFLQPPVCLSVLFKDCPVQFISEEDLLRVLTRILEVPEFKGAFNVAPDDYTTLKTLAASVPLVHLRLPGLLLWLAWLAAGLARPRSGLHQGAASFLAFPVVVDNKKLKHALSMEFKTRSEAAFGPCLHALRGGAAGAAGAAG